MFENSWAPVSVYTVRKALMSGTIAINGSVAKMNSCILTLPLEEDGQCSLAILSKSVYSIQIMRTRSA